MFKVGDEVIIVNVEGRSTPAFAIDKPGIVIMIDKTMVAPYAVDIGGLFAGFYEEELTIKSFFRNVDYEVI